VAALPGSPTVTATPLPSGSSPSGSGLFPRLVAFLRRHPVFCLFLLTPGLPEYLSGSSSFVFLVASPLWFFLALGINAAMYTSGALLVREALIRWKKGWPTMFALGAAYAIMEEGVADQTTFNPHSSPIGSAGTYGHFAGVNWLWFPDILLIHILISLFVPILLLGYALPETRGRWLLTDRQVGIVTVLIALDTAFLTFLVVSKTGYWYGYPMLGVTVVVIAALCLVGWRLPARIGLERSGPPVASRAESFLVGAIVYPLIVLEASVGANRNLSPIAVFLVILATLAAALVWALRRMGTERNERHVVAFTAGLLVLLIGIGWIASFPFELVLIADTAVVYFLVWLDRDLERRATPVAVPPGVSPGPSPA